MKALAALALSLLLASCSTTRPAAPRAVDIRDVEKQLQSTGCVGWIHGSVPGQGMFVFTYRNPENFFDYVIMSLVTKDPTLARKLESFGRHDQVRIKGSFLENASPQKHILISSVELVKKYQAPEVTEPYNYQAKIPSDLLRKDAETFLVHAIGGDGHILVVEYQDSTIPIYVNNKSLTAGLYRNDVVRIRFLFQDYPDSPLHLAINETAPDPLVVTDSIAAKNGKPASVEGALVFFPKSPEILFNVFAVQELLPHGLSRQYTLVNFEQPEVFKKIRELLQKAWDKYPSEVVNGRNKLLSKVVRVKANGTFNEVDPNQANAQILLTSVDSIVVEDKR